MSRALVTDARLIMALPIIRSLGRAGVEVVAMESALRKSRFILGFHSRYTAHRIFCNDLSASLVDKADKVDVVFPVSGQAVYAVARGISNRPSSHGVSTKVALPSLDSIEIANDKTRLNDLAKSLGVPVPRTYHPELSLELNPSRDLSTPAGEHAPPPSNALLSRIQAELKKWSQNLTFPVIVKYRYGEGLNLPANKRYFVVRNPEEFCEAYVRIHQRQPFPLVQEYISGEDFGAAILCDKDSNSVASFTYRSIRQRPRVGGPTSFAESKSYPAMVNHLEKIARALSWYGIAMGDFRLTPDGQFRLLEINPRFWGSLALAVEAGVDFPLLYYDLVMNHGHLKTPSVRQKDGVFLKFFFQDMVAIWEYAKAARRPLLYAANQLTRLLSPKVKDAVFSMEDPKPGIAYILSHLF